MEKEGDWIEVKVVLTYIALVSILIIFLCSI